MVDSRLKSLSETGINIAIGYFISLAVNWIVLPAYGVAPQWDVMVSLSIIYTVISVIRSYGFRRLFERFGEQENAYTLLVRGLKKARIVP